jgi:hypothetical protein
MGTRNFFTEIRVRGAMRDLKSAGKAKMMELNHGKVVGG